MWLHLMFVIANAYVAFVYCERYSFAFWINLLAVALNASAWLRLVLEPVATTTSPVMKLYWQ